MINIPPIKPSTEIKTELMPDVTRVWKTGQILNATVEKGGEHLSRILLRIGGQQVEAKTPVSLKSGEQIKLLVKALEPEPLLQIQSQPTASPGAASQLKLFIAAQASIRPVLQVTQQTEIMQILPAPVKQSLQALVESIPRLTDLIQAMPLKTASQHAGHLLESRLLQQPHNTDFNQDIKARLLHLADSIKQQLPAMTTGSQARLTENQVLQAIPKLLQALTDKPESIARLVNQLGNLLSPSQLKQLVQSLQQPNPLQYAEQAAVSQPVKQVLQNLLQHTQLNQQQQEQLQQLLQQHVVLKDLHQMTEHSLARITTHQLTPLTQSDHALLLLFDLPFRFKDQLHLVECMIEEENQHGNDTASWSVTLNFEFDPLGPVEARLHLIEHQLSARFKAELGDTARLIQKHLPMLQTALDKAGFRIASLDVSQEKPRAPQPLSSTTGLLDEQA